MCQFRFDIWIFETIRIIPNVAARLPADVTRCVAELSAPDEMSALIRPTHLHYNSYLGGSFKMDRNSFGDRRSRGCTGQ